MRALPAASSTPTAYATLPRAGREPRGLAGELPLLLVDPVDLILVIWRQGVKVFGSFRRRVLEVPLRPGDPQVVRAPVLLLLKFPPLLVVTLKNRGGISRPLEGVHRHDAGGGRRQRGVGVTAQGGGRAEGRRPGHQKPPIPPALLVPMLVRLDTPASR